MRSPKPVFVIPTHRLRDVGATVESYDEHFRKNGHSIDMVVFDDSSAVNQQKYFPLLEQTTTQNPLWYVGPQEKEQFLSLLFARLKDRKLEPLIRNLFRPSYGGNRNWTLIYTLGDHMISADDDMRPFALMEDSPETLDDGVVCRGSVKRHGQNGYTKKSFDILTAFQDVLGKPVRDTPLNHERGALLIDTAMDLETNASQGLHRENNLQLKPGVIDDAAIIKMAQTFRSGTNDIDALDFVEMYLDDDAQVSIEELNEVYVLENFRPAITELNWRMDCGVAGYDNTLGLPPFFPTRLRFEDYIYRLWIQQPGFVSAHVDAAQNHMKNNYMRDPLPSEVFNEEVANLLKRKIKGSVSKIDELSIMFDYEGEVTQGDSDTILGRIRELHGRVIAASRKARGARRESLKTFAVSLERAFFGFDSDFFQQKLIYIVDDVINQFKGSLEIWPTLVEICFLRKQRAELPRLRVANQRRH
ncbi:MAG: hypothetical protein JWR16_27 [Nevskia sp.]|nr:hypothetical protein [Nevskia sp.]